MDPSEPPKQDGKPCAIAFAVGVGLTVISIVVPIEQDATPSGVKVYVVVPVVAVLIVDGVQVPVILLLEVVGKVPGVSPEQYGPMASKVGVIIRSIVIVKVCVVAHCPADGVNV
jgi:hypothetical protein